MIPSRSSPLGPQSRRNFSYTSVFATLASMAVSTGLAAAAGSVVKVEKDANGGFELMRNGQPFFIKGAGGTSNLEQLVKYGGNSIRTWGVEQLETKVNGKPLLDRAQELGLAVTVGLWVKHERHGFNYSDPMQVQTQRDEIRAAVRKYKDHPAVLMWGLGNEMEGPTSDGADPRIWKELDELARIVKEEDPNHPVMTVIAGAGPVKVKGVMQYYPSIDVLGVNAYGGASDVGKALKQAGWQKPFVLTEFGPLGHWEVPKTAWGAPIEPTSRQKAGSYYATQTSVVEDGKGTCLGTYVFLWGQKQEVTSTWYGMFLKTGEKLPTVDAMVKAWSGKWPENRCPKILSVETPLREVTVGAGQEIPATATAEDPEGDPLTYDWKVYAESTDRKEGGDAEAEPPLIDGCVVAQKGGSVTIRTPKQAGPYRLFLTVKDGKGNAGAENIPFLVK